MEKKERTHTLDRKYAEKLLGILRNQGPLNNASDNEVLERIEVDFKDGMIIEIDVCNGDSDDNSSPYINVNWYKDNKCLYAFDTDPEGELFGTYDFVYEDDDDDDNEINYLLHLLINEKVQ